MNAEPAIAAVEVDPLADARDRLRHAHEAKRHAEAKLGEAQAAHARGQELAHAMQAEIDELDRQNDMLAQRAAEKIAAGIKGVSADDREEQAPSIQERLAARAMSVQRHAYAQRAAEQLKAEVEQAEGEVARAKYQIEAAIGHLLLLEGERIAAEVLEHEAAAYASRNRLAGLARLWIARGSGDNRTSALRMGVKALGVLNDLPLNSEHRQHPAAHNPVDVELALWQTCASALLKDAEAAVESD
jgi:hypothetical protein